MGDVDPNFDFGNDVFITEDGYVPETLVSTLGEEVVWHNETNEPQGVDFATRRS